MGLRIINFAGNDPQQQLEFEEQLFRQVQTSQQPACLFYSSEPCIVLGRNNRAEEWVHTAHAAADDLPVLRRITGGGAVFLNRDVLNFSFTVPRSQLEAGCRAGGQMNGPMSARYIAFFRQLIICALQRGGGEFTASGTSDISLNGRKISGNAQRISARAALHHGTLLLRCPLAQFERYLLIPPDRPGVPHRQFVSGLAEQGYSQSPAQLQDWLAAELAFALAVEQP